MSGALYFVSSVWHRRGREAGSSLGCAGRVVCAPAARGAGENPCGRRSLRPCCARRVTLARTFRLPPRSHCAPAARLLWAREGGHVASMGSLGMWPLGMWPWWVLPMGGPRGRRGASRRGRQRVLFYQLPPLLGSSSRWDLISPLV